MMPEWYWTVALAVGAIWLGAIGAAIYAWNNARWGHRREEARSILWCIAAWPIVTTFWIIVIPAAIIVGLFLFFADVIQDARSEA